jgi:guanine deaminase
MGLAQSLLGFDMAVSKQIFIGPFVHCKSQHEFDICEAGAIGVDETGKIAFIERDVENADAVAKKHGWQSFKVVKLRDQGFYFPGFIGTYMTISNPLDKQDCRRLLKS